MKNILKNILLILLIILIAIVSIQIFKKDKKEEVKEKLVVNDKTIIVDLGDVALLVNDSIITNVIYYNYTGRYILGDKKIINTELDNLLNISEALNTYNRLTEISVYEDYSFSADEIDIIFQSKRYYDKLVIYPSLELLQEKVSKYNLKEDIKKLNKVELIKLLYKNSKQIIEEVNKELEKENMDYKAIKAYMLRESDDIKIVIENKKEVKIYKKLGEIDSKNRIYYCYEDNRTEKCFIYDYVGDKKKQIFINEKLMKLNYSYYIDYEANYSTSIVDGNLLCQKKDGSWLSIDNYIKDTQLEFYPEYLECITKKDK